LIRIFLAGSSVKERERKNDLRAILNAFIVLRIQQGEEAAISAALPIEPPIAFPYDVDTEIPLVLKDRAEMDCPPGLRGIHDEEVEHGVHPATLDRDSAGDVLVDGEPWR
jgi:hypothetical protein